METLSRTPVNPYLGNADSRWPWIMLLLRSGLFLAWQALTAACLALLGTPAPWTAAGAWWPVSATLTNLICFLLLRRLAHREGMKWSLLINADFSRKHLGGDLLILLGILVLCVPVAMVPVMGLAQLLFGDAQSALRMFIQPLPVSVAAAFLFLFPITQSFGELPAYFGYAMPRLAIRWNSPWRSIAVSAFWLSAQHAALPLLPDIRFILWRLGMFLPFALLLGLAIQRRPRLLPYLMVIHALIDFPVGLMVWQASVPLP